MTWAALLLADPSPCLRWLVLRDLLGRPEDDEEVRELGPQREGDPLVRDLLVRQSPEGSWAGLGVGAQAGVLTSTSLALARLGYLGFGAEFAAVAGGAEYLFSRQRDDGSWPLASGTDEDDEGAREGYTMKPLQTAQPLRALAACGYACDPRAERAYAWLEEQRLPDGAWPTGIVAGVWGGVGGYRRLAHSRWGCRSSTTAALAALALHDVHRREEPARHALDLLLGRETREQQTLGFEVARTLGAEEARGTLTHFARYDLAQVLDLCARVGTGVDDPRVADAVSFVREQQGTYGLWEYARRPQVSRWVTFDLLRSLSRIDQDPDWVLMEPRTAFRPYLRPPRRY